MIVTYYPQHPFYQRFLLESRDNRAIITAVDYLALAKEDKHAASVFEIAAMGDALVGFRYQRAIE